LASWYHLTGPTSDQADELNVISDDNDVRLLKGLLYKVAREIPIGPAVRQTWVHAVLDKFQEVGLHSIRDCLSNIMTINWRLMDHGRTPMFQGTLNILARQSVDALFPDPPIEPLSGNSDDESYHVNSVDSGNKNPNDNGTISKCVLRIQYAKEAYAKLPNPPHYRKTLLALVDSGASASIVRGCALPPHVTRIHKEKTVFNTQGGNFATYGMAHLPFIPPDFAKHRKVNLDFHVDDTKIDNPRYDIILGRDFLTRLGIVLNFVNRTIVWDNVSLDMSVGSRNTKCVDVLMPDDYGFQLLEKVTL
jgi:hypothetical protein